MSYLRLKYGPKFKTKTENVRNRYVINEETRNVRKIHFTFISGGWSFSITLLIYSIHYMNLLQGCVTAMVHTQSIIITVIEGFNNLISSLLFIVFISPKKV